MMKIKKPKFKRGKGKDGGWGAGLDYLLKPHWDDLDVLIEHNYYARHDKKLINRLFKAAKIALNNSIPEMKKLCRKGPGLDDWIKEAKKIGNFGKSAKKESEKVIFIDAAVQFLRATTTGPRKRTVKKEKKEKIRKTKKLIGMIACTPVKKVRGIARIVGKAGDFSKFKTREILITKETNPDFLPIMKKAKAFIASEGGVLCHAAIVAREMKKPCIVAVKNADKIVRNGDLIEMDLANGKIKILS
jgi:phosphohistidine swiveling domain-containing protein